MPPTAVPTLPTPATPDLNPLEAFRLNLLNDLLNLSIAEPVFLAAIPATFKPRLDKLVNLPVSDLADPDADCIDLLFLNSLSPYLPV